MKPGARALARLPMQVYPQEDARQRGTCQGSTPALFHGRKRHSWSGYGCWADGLHRAYDATGALIAKHELRAAWACQHDDGTTNAQITQAGSPRTSPRTHGNRCGRDRPGRRPRRTARSTHGRMRQAGSTLRQRLPGDRLQSLELHQLRHRTDRGRDPIPGAQHREPHPTGLEPAATQPPGHRTLGRRPLRAWRLLHRHRECRVPQPGQSARASATVAAGARRRPHLPDGLPAHDRGAPGQRRCRDGRLHRGAARGSFTLWRAGHRRRLQDRLVHGEAGQSRPDTPPQRPGAGFHGDLPVRFRDDRARTAGRRAHRRIQPRLRPRHDPAPHPQPPRTRLQFPRRQGRTLLLARRRDAGFVLRHQHGPARPCVRLRPRAQRLADPRPQPQLACRYVRVWGPAAASPTPSSTTRCLPRT
jgi:hypothetical protein